MEWKIVFGYQLGTTFSSQSFYDEIIKAALTYKFKNLKNIAIPVDGKTLTESIFKLNAKDQIQIGKKKIVSGQKIKELFITSIFLKVLERKFEPGDLFFIVIPNNEDTSCDAAVMVAKSDKKVELINNERLKLPPEHFSFEFQIKELLDFNRLNSSGLLSPRKADIQSMNALAGDHKYKEETVLIFIRDFIPYKGDDFKEFFEAHQNCYLISSLGFLEKDGKMVYLDSDKHNYAITCPSNTSYIESFDRPRSLVSF